MDNTDRGEGTFLIRCADTYDKISLSILDYNDDQGFSVKSYHIRQSDDQFFISRKGFSTLQQLVAYYSGII